MKTHKHVDGLDDVEHLSPFGTYVEALVLNEIVIDVKG